jgi:L-arabinonolactonase
LAEEDGLVAALADGFYRIHPETGAASPIFRPPGIKAPVRFNDGKTDRDGRFLSATMTAGDLQTPNGTLWRLNTAGTAELIERDFIIGNALCFSPDGESLYFSDTMEGTIRQYDYDRTGGGIGNRRDVIDCRPYGSGPDGATVDADGNLWVALIQAQKIACFKPDGALVQLMDVPLPFPACLAFAGEDMDVLIVTGISDSGWTMKAEGPEAGRILAISGLHARGIAETPFRHSHDT